MAKGRPRKPITNLILEGNFRPSRHGDLSATWQPDGEPIKPDWLTGDGAKLWDALVPQLAARGVATQIDEAELAAACNWWSLYRATWIELSSIREKQSTEFYRVAILASMAWKNFASAAAKFGLNPSDRARLRLGNGETSKDQLAEFAASRDS
jgi:P27 family predicted phage terminase small subunit